MVADGYPDDPAATAARFVAAPTPPGERIYRTDRSAYWDSSGFLVLDAPSTPMARTVAPEDGSPPTETEQRLIAIAEELLDYRGIRRGDSFFAIGGDSVLSIQWSSRASAAGLPLTPRMIFENPTIAEVAAALDATTDTPDNPGQEPVDDAHAPMSASGLSDDAVAAVAAAWKASR